MSDEAKLEKLLLQLKDDSVKKRKKACEELGKLGDPKAIIELTRVYKDEYEDPSVKESAAVSLRYFAMLEMSDGEIKSGGSGIARGLTALLTLSLIGLVVFNVLLRMGSSSDSAEGTPQPTEISLVNATQSPRGILLDNMTNNVVLSALNDVNALRTEWGAGAGNLPCTAEINHMSVVPISPADRAAYPDIATVVDELNGALSDISLVVRTWEDACASTEKGTADQVTIAQDKLTSAETILFKVADDIVTAQAQPTPEATPLPPTPKPTIAANILAEVERRANAASASMTSLINDRWTPIQNGDRSPFGCSPPPIPENYTEVTEEMIVADEDLGIAVVELNVALGLARQSVTAYVTSCEANNFDPAVVTQGIADATEAQAHLNTVSIALDTLRQR